MPIDPSFITGVQSIRVHRYDNNGEDLSGNIKYARYIRIDHNGDVRGYKVLSAILDPNDNSVYYVEVRADKTSQPSGGTALAVALTPNLNLDIDYHEYNALYNNADENVYARRTYKVVRNTLAGTPDNIDNINDRTEELAEIHDDMYTDTGLSNARYEGSKNTSTDVNVYKAGDASGFRAPAVELTQDYYAYFNYIGGTSPELPNKVAADIKYLIGASGSIIDPKTDDDAVHFLKENFEGGDEVLVELDDPKAFGNEMSSLNGTQLIKVSGVYHSPIVNNHFPAMPSYIVSGSGSFRYGIYSIFKNIDTEALVATTTGTAFDFETGGPGTYSTYWITGSENFTRSINNINLYDNELYRQVGVGVSTSNGYFSDWIATGELEEGEDYDLGLSIEGFTMDVVYTNATGYNTILDPLKIEAFDYITFHSTEYPNWRNTFQILEVVYSSSQNEVYLRLDRPIEVVETAGSYEWTGLNRNKYSITRRKTSPTLVTLDTDKPPGATSGGILRPKYVSEETEKAIKETLSDMRGKGMI